MSVLSWSFSDSIRKLRSPDRYEQGEAPNLVFTEWYSVARKYAASVKSDYSPPNDDIIRCTKEAFSILLGLHSSCRGLLSMHSTDEYVVRACVDKIIQLCKIFRIKPKFFSLLCNSKESKSESKLSVQFSDLTKWLASEPVNTLCDSICNNSLPTSNRVECSRALKDILTLGSCIINNQNNHIFQLSHKVLCKIADAATSTGTDGCLRDSLIDLLEISGQVRRGSTAATAIASLLIERADDEITLGVVWRLGALTSPHCLSLLKKRASSSSFMLNMILRTAVSEVRNVQSQGLKRTGIKTSDSDDIDQDGINSLNTGLFDPIQHSIPLCNLIASCDVPLVQSSEVFDDSSTNDRQDAVLELLESIIEAREPQCSDTILASLERETIFKDPSNVNNNNQNYNTVMKNVSPTLEGTVVATGYSSLSQVPIADVIQDKTNDYLSNCIPIAAEIICSSEGKTSNKNESKTSNKNESKTPNKNESKTSIENESKIPNKNESKIKPTTNSQYIVAPFVRLLLKDVWSRNLKTLTSASSLAGCYGSLTWETVVLPFIYKSLLSMETGGASGLETEQEIINLLREGLRVHYMSEGFRVPMIALGKFFFDTTVLAMSKGYIETERFPELATRVLLYHSPLSFEWLIETLQNKSSSNTYGAVKTFESKCSSTSIGNTGNIYVTHSYPTRRALVQVTLLLLRVQDPSGEYGSEIAAVGEEKATSTSNVVGKCLCLADADRLNVLRRLAVVRNVDAESVWIELARNHGKIISTYSTALELLFHSVNEELSSFRTSLIRLNQISTLLQGLIHGDCVLTPLIATLFFHVLITFFTAQKAYTENVNHIQYTANENDQDEKYLLLKLDDLTTSKVAILMDEFPEYPLLQNERGSKTDPSSRLFPLIVDYPNWLHFFGVSTRIKLCALKPFTFLLDRNMLVRAATFVHLMSNIEQGKISLDVILQYADIVFDGCDLAHNICQSDSTFGHTVDDELMDYSSMAANLLCSATPVISYIALHSPKHSLQVLQILVIAYDVVLEAEREAAGVQATVGGTGVGIRQAQSLRENKRSGGIMSNKEDSSQMCIIQNAIEAIARNKNCRYKLFSSIQQSTNNSSGHSKKNRKTQKNDIHTLANSLIVLCPEWQPRENECPGYSCQKNSLTIPRSNRRVIMPVTEHTQNIASGVPLAHDAYDIKDNTQMNIKKM